MADILFKCSGCAAPLAVETDTIGQAIECPNCQQKVLVPEAGVTFTCGKCKAALAAPAGLVGSTCDCPNCETQLTVPKPSGKPLLLKRPTPRPAPAAAAPAPPRPSRRCPYCGGGVAPAAIICVNCGTNLQTGRRYGASQSATPSSPNPTGVFIGIVLGVVVLLGVAVLVLKLTQPSEQVWTSSAVGTVAAPAEAAKAEATPTEAAKAEAAKAAKTEAAMAKAAEERKQAEAEQRKVAQATGERGDQDRIRSVVQQAVGDKTETKTTTETTTEVPESKRTHDAIVVSPCTSAR